MTFSVCNINICIFQIQTKFTSFFHLLFILTLPHPQHPFATNLISYSLIKMEDRKLLTLKTLHALFHALTIPYTLCVLFLQRSEAEGSPEVFYLGCIVGVQFMNTIFSLIDIVVIIPKCFAMMFFQVGRDTTICKISINSNLHFS